MILYHFAGEAQTSRYFDKEILLFEQKSPTYFNNLKKYSKFLGFLGTLVETPVETPVENNAHI